MNDIYAAEKNIEKILKGKHTFFLDYKLQELVKRKLHKKLYNIYLPYKDSEKVIYYCNDIPNVSLLKITSKIKLKHQDILGALFSLGIDPSMYGDILIIDDNYYIYVLDIMKNYLVNNLVMINNCKIIIDEVELSLLNNYERKYENIELIASSNRIDNVIAHLIHLSRDDIINKINNKEIFLNYEIPKYSTNLKIGDIISIRKYGKYKYLGIINKTKKDNLIICINKYI